MPNLITAFLSNAHEPLPTERLYGKPVGAPLTDEEVEALKATTSSKQWVAICDVIKSRRAGLWPSDFNARIQETGLDAQIAWSRWEEHNGNRATAERVPTKAKRGKPTSDLHIFGGKRKSKSVTKPRGDLEVAEPTAPVTAGRGDSKFTGGTDSEANQLDEKASLRRTLWAIRLLLLMVVELHRRGFEKLRIAPYISSSGAYWRCRFVPKAYTRRANGAMVASRFEEMLSNEDMYTSGADFNYFDWGDCSRRPPVELADRFEQRFRAMLHDVRGSDREYVEWFREMLRRTEPLGFVYAFAEWPTSGNGLSVGGECEIESFLLPPPGTQPD